MQHKPSVSTKELYEAQQYYFDVTYDRWINDVLFTFNWWFLLLILIVPLFIWWKWVDKTRIMEIVLVGLLIGILATFLDLTGIFLSVWTYNYTLIQFFPSFNPVNFSLLPVSYMLLYQWVPQWKWFIILLTFAAAFGAFLAEPLFIWMHIYDQTWWKHIYSFLIYIAMGIGVKALAMKMKSIQEQHRRKKE